MQFPIRVIFARTARGPFGTRCRAKAVGSRLPLKLTVNGEVHQDASTALQIFPVAAVIEFVSAFVTLEPGDIISTGTAAGVGHAKGVHLRSGDIVEASIDGIGVLKNKMVSE